jgi:hypothetical protein
MSESDENKTRVVRPAISRLQRPADRDANDPDETRKLTEDGGRSRDRKGPPPLPNETKKNQGETQLVRPKLTPEAKFDPLGEKSAETASDPVVGWLVVVKGPGRGNALQLGYGFNDIGRDASQRVRLDFGDEKISRLKHVRLFYDARARKFSLTLGDGINPTYVRGEALLAPTELKSGDRIQLGDTDLLLVALCGENFEWQDEE